jgi:hypothetical protein
VTANAAAVILSMGKDWATSTSADQLENVGATLGGGPSGVNYRVAADSVFVTRTESARPGAEFDDLVTWVAPASLYGQMVAAGRLP